MRQSEPGPAAWWVMIGAALAPRVAAVRAAHRGKGRTRRPLALNREEGMHPFYTLKSLVGVVFETLVVTWSLMPRDAGIPAGASIR